MKVRRLGREVMTAELLVIAGDECFVDQITLNDGVE
jgi:hypothetical protein